MNLVESLQKLLPWAADLPPAPKLLLTALVVVAASLFLLLIWVPPPAHAPISSESAKAVEQVISELLRKQGSREKNVRVADYLDRVADIIDATVVDFRAGRIPHGHFSQLSNLGSDFGDMLAQAYGDDDDRAHMYKIAVYQATSRRERRCDDPRGGW